MRRGPSPKRRRPAQPINQDKRIRGGAELFQARGLLLLRRMKSLAPHKQAERWRKFAANLHFYFILFYFLGVGGAFERVSEFATEAECSKPIFEKKNNSLL